MSVARVAAIATALVWAAAAPAQVHVAAPTIYTDAEGPGSNNALIRNQNQPRTTQLIYNANQLTGLVGSQITGITYRLSATLPGGYPLVTTTWADYRISLGPAVLPAAATTTFANNFTAPPTLVRSGPLTAPPLAWTVSGGPQPSAWGMEINFDTPYLYAGGPLGLLVTHPGSDNPSEGNSLLDAAGSASPGLHVDYTVYIANSMGAATGTRNDFPNVVRFTGTTPVPEPSALVLLGTAAPLAWRRARRGAGA